MKLLIFFIVFISCAGLDEQDSNEPNVVDNNIDNKTVKRKVPPRSLSYSPNSDKINVANLGSFNSETLDGINPGVAGTTNDEILSITNLCRSGRAAAGQAKAATLHNKYSKWPTYWNAIGLCYYIQNNNYSAKIFFNKALDINRSFSPAKNNLGLIAIREQNWLLARDLFKSAVQLNPASQVANFNLGRLYLAFGHGNKASNHFSRIKDKNFYSKNVLGKHAMAYSMSGNHKKAISLFSKANDSSESAKLFKSYSYAKLGKKQEAKAIISTIQVSPNNANYGLFSEVKRIIK